jgi:hypothetical protein
MKTIRSLVFLLPLILSACGGGQPAVKVDTELPPAEFKISPPAQPLDFDVELTSTTQFSGREMVQYVNFHWRADRWRDETDSTRTARVKFTKVKGMQRTGSATTMDPIPAFERLEGFTQDYRLDAEGFSALDEPNRDPEFMGAYGQLSMGLSTLDFASTDRPIAAGETWTEVMPLDEMGPIAPVAQDSLVHLTYMGPGRWKSWEVAKVKMEAEIPLDGRIQSGPADSHIKGRIKVQGTGFYSPVLGFFVHFQGKQESLLNIQNYEGEERLGGESTVDQSGEFKISYSGR